MATPRTAVSTGVSTGLRRRLLWPPLLALGLTLATPLPGALPEAAAQDCSQQATGEELPENAGPYPLIEQLGLRQAWDLATGEGVTVAVLDSGVDREHPDLAGAVARGSEFTVVPEEREFVRTTPERQRDCPGHGTAVAGMIAANRAEGDRMAGVAPGSVVYPVRIADGVDRATPNTLAAAVDDAVAADVDILNLSFAYPVDAEPLRAAVARAVDAGVLVVAAAGNEGNEGNEGGNGDGAGNGEGDGEGDAVPMYPAAYEGVLTVGAVGEDGQPLETSNAGDWVDLAGYGQELAVAAPGGGYRVEAGTSFATAQVSGAAALVLSRFPDLTAAQLADRLTESANPVGGGRGERTGAGIVDPFAALTHLDGAGDGATDGATGDQGEAAARPGHIPVRPIPEDRPLLSPTAATALGWTGGLLLAVALGLLGAPAVRRAARRGWHAGPTPEERAPAAREPAPPPPPLDWLRGTPDANDRSTAARSPARPPARPHARNRTR
ncbi:S8 family serine peptidase [Streptomyces sp. 3MP-14]|uniref:S8 family serine peptidase n=1 Tax=Streptomyces mimosae TaxID=2586635 RepID=A0A5N6AJX5_9ACTN|nr:MULTISPECIES: S8 family serine peptidase [Streptomyces]KAB8167878.1 S8 family serine peptidase [Streptomyces mimosae]KAB8177474.1 S8 family serine peptidase [Streptomyces sp. 3MP-14]